MEEKSCLKPCANKRGNFVWALLILVIFPELLNAQPAIITNHFESSHLEDGKLTGELGGEELNWTIEFNSEVNLSSLDNNDLEIVGIAGDALGKTIPTRLFASYSPPDVTNKSGVYFAGPLDSDANGTYSFRIKEGEITGTGDPPGAIPGGELFQFEQALIGPFQFMIQGRNFIDNGPLQDPPKEPSLEDDGWEEDPGVNLVPELEVFVSGEWFNHSESIFFYHPDDEQNWGRYEFLIDAPGEFRLRNSVGTNEPPFEAPPWPEWILQAVGDPSRVGEPKDHEMYFTVSEAMDGQTLILNFSYFEENDSPEANADDADEDPQFKVLPNSQAVQLDVLKNDTVNGHAPESDELTIIGLGPWIGFYSDTSSTGSRDSVITTDGKFVYYTPRAVSGEWEQFYYTIEDMDGNRDFAEVLIFVTNEVEKQFDAVDDKTKIRYNSPFTPINVLVNDTVNPTGSLSDLTLVSVTPPTNPDALSGFNPDSGEVFYQPAPDFIGTDFFSYVVTDGSTGFEAVLIEVEVLEVWDPPLDIAANYWTLGNFYQSSEGGRYLLSLFKQYCAELSYILFRAVAGTGAKFELQSDISDPHRHPFFDLQRGTEETENAVIDLLRNIQPGFSALFTGQGETEVITQEIVDDLKALQAIVVAEASPQLKEAIQNLSDSYNSYDDFVGETFNGWANMVGLDPEAISIPALTVDFKQQRFSISTYATPGVSFKLWKSPNLDPESWVEVENVEIREERIFKFLTDPTPQGDRIFYRVTSDLEQ